MTDRLAEAPHVVPPSLVHRDLEPGLGGQRLEYPGARGGGPAVRQAHPATQAHERQRVGSAPHLGVVDPGDLLPRMEKPVGERAVVREEEESGRVEIEAPDGVQALRDAPEETPHRRPALGVAERAHHDARLVEHQGAGRTGAREAGAVDGDRVAERIGARPELVHHGAVQRDAARPDELLRLPPRGKPGGADQLLQALGQRLPVAARAVLRDRLHTVGRHGEVGSGQELGAVSELAERRERVQVRQSEHLEELPGGGVKKRSPGSVLPPDDTDEASIEEVREHRVDVDAADRLDFHPGTGLTVGDDR